MFNFLENKHQTHENTEKGTKHKKSNSTNKILINNMENNRQSFVQKANIFVNHSLVKESLVKSLKARQSLYL